MTITYILGNSLYVNITNECSNNCVFCVRSTSSGVGDADDLRLEREPTREEIFEDLMARPLASFDELVFCGFGEPACRLDDMLWLCKKIRKRSGIKIRINTNGHASLLHGYDVSDKFRGLADTISISLNAPNSARYNEICRPQHGEKAFYAVLDFAASVKNHVPEVVLSVVDTITPQEIEACRGIAESLETSFRIRKYSENG